MIEEQRTELPESGAAPKVSPQKRAKQKKVASEDTNKQVTSNRVTRSKVNGIIAMASLDQRRKALLEQERKDFEYAKRVQRQLNQESRVVTSGYSLRRASNLASSKPFNGTKRKASPAPPVVQGLRRSTRRSNNNH